MGLFRSMKDLASITKQGKALGEEHQQQAGYKPGMRGSIAQMGDMLGQAKEQLENMASQAGDRDRLLAEGVAGQGVVISHGVPPRAAESFNLAIDMEIHVPGRQPYRIANDYMVPAGVPFTPGSRLPVRVDPDDPAKIAIDWDSAHKAPELGQVRPVSGASPALASAPGATSHGGGDSLAELERLAKLRDSGALTDAEFEHQKARILGG